MAMTRKEMLVVLAAGVLGDSECEAEAAVKLAWQTLEGIEKRLKLHETEQQTQLKNRLVKGGNGQ